MAGEAVRRMGQEGERGHSGGWATWQVQGEKRCSLQPWNDALYNNSGQPCRAWQRGRASGRGGQIADSAGATWRESWLSSQACGCGAAESADGQSWARGGNSRTQRKQRQGEGVCLVHLVGVAGVHGGQWPDDR